MKMRMITTQLCQPEAEPEEGHELENGQELGPEHHEPESGRFLDKFSSFPFLLKKTHIFCFINFIYI